MAKYFARSCPRCNGYVGIVIREAGRNVGLQAVNGRCTQCRCRMDWFVIRGKASSGDKIRKGKSYLTSNLSIAESSGYIMLIAMVAE
jgi:hypothetical protein